MYFKTGDIAYFQVDDETTIPVEILEVRENGEYYVRQVYPDQAYDLEFEAKEEELS